jgi:uncharacterized Rossmann fold enzyme
MQTVATDTCFDNATTRFLDAPETVSDDELRAALEGMNAAVEGLSASVDRRGQAIDRLDASVVHLLAVWGATAVMLLAIGCSSPDVAVADLDARPAAAHYGAGGPSVRTLVSPPAYRATHLISPPVFHAAYLRGGQ